jgi:hypothetical protein
MMVGAPINPCKFAGECIMPILSFKDNPPSKPFESSFLEKEGIWWVAQVKSRHEKAFALDLYNQGVDYYLPYYVKTKQRTDGKFRKSYLVLFPSYVPFIAREPFQYFKLKRVVNIIPIKAQKSFRIQLNYVHAAYGPAHQVLPIEQNNTFIPGDPAEVIKGPCKGLSGKIARVNGNKCFVLQVEILGSALVLIPESYIRPVKSELVSRTAIG